MKRVIRSWISSYKCAATIKRPRKRKRTVSARWLCGKKATVMLSDGRIRCTYHANRAIRRAAK